MKIPLREIHPNPFKKFIMGGNLVLAKVQELEASIRETTFWDNIIVRPAPDGKGYELGYGHHRLEAVKNVFGETHVVDIPVREFDEETMLKVLALENGPDKNAPVQAQIDQVLAAREWRLAHPESLSASVEADKGGGRDRSPSPGSERDIAIFLGEKTWSPATVHRLLQLAKLPDEVQERIAPPMSERTNQNQGLTMSAALEVAKLDDAKEQKQVADIVEHAKDAKGESKPLGSDEARVLVQGLKEDRIEPEIKESIKHQVRSGVLRGEDKIRMAVDIGKEQWEEAHRTPPPVVEKREPVFVVDVGLVKKLTKSLKIVNEAIDAGFSLINCRHPNLDEGCAVLDFVTELSLIAQFYNEQGKHFPTHLGGRTNE